MNAEMDVVMKMVLVRRRRRPTNKPTIPFNLCLALCRYSSALLLEYTRIHMWGHMSQWVLMHYTQVISWSAIRSRSGTSRRQHKQQQQRNGTPSAEQLAIIIMIILWKARPWKSWLVFAPHPASQCFLRLLLLMMMLQIINRIMTIHVSGVAAWCNETGRICSLGSIPMDHRINKSANGVECRSLSPSLCQLLV